MESLDNKSSVTGFFKHVFNFDQDSKNDMLNILQYTFLAIIPIVAINKAMQKYVPEASEDKGSVELTMEIVLQTTLMFLGILFVSRIIDYIPTFSGVSYPEFKVVYIIIAVLMITMSLQTKLGEKVNILTIRLYDAWNGTSSQQKKKPVKGGNGNVQVSQPIANNQLPPNPTSPTQEAYNMSLGGQNQQVMGATPINNLGVEQVPNYTNMYADQPNPLVNANVPGQLDQGPVAASEFGGFGGSLFG